MVKGNGDLHVLILCVRVTVSQKHHLVMVGEVVVGNGNGGGPVNRVDQPVAAVGE